MWDFLIDWDSDDEPDGNTAHIAEHDISPDEVEDVLRNPANPTDTSDSSGRPSGSLALSLAITGLG